MTAFDVACTVHTCVLRLPGRSSSGTRVHTTPDALAISTAATLSQTRSYSSSAGTSCGSSTARAPPLRWYLHDKRAARGVPVGKN